MFEKRWIFEVVSSGRQNLCALRIGVSEIDGEMGRGIGC
jgi:hypothetical protein